MNVEKAFKELKKALLEDENKDKAILENIECVISTMERAYTNAPKHSLCKNCKHLYGGKMGEKFGCDITPRSNSWVYPGSCSSYEEK